MAYVGSPDNHFGLVRYPVS
ncbi:uncharacterized protein G2W53_043608 [Senna tora]|uniref:Uncharacterized protein n=1 Tax=Senna tora TaxID=362788 RepID=A0A834SP76_9FABA|nr:uncharacterized protein G2W53_043608 [Senna tora]